MKRFFCDCSAEIFFNNLNCNSCSKAIAFNPKTITLITGQTKEGWFFHSNHAYKVCEHRYHYVGCNWLVEDENIGNNQCMSCRLTEQIPDQSLMYNQNHWESLELSKRRLIYNLIQLNLKVLPTQTKQKLRFHFLEDIRSNPAASVDMVMTGHKNGLITINSAEADEKVLLDRKQQLGESYRSLLGHFRHEIGHFFWYELIENSNYLNQFRELFGDETIDYEQALKVYYHNHTHKVSDATYCNNDWREQYISAYCQSHPYEDWAETWAHYLHMTDGLETAISYSVCEQLKENSFDERYLQWLKSTQLMNALNRSMGLSDSYPFAITKNVKKKLEFIDFVVKENQKLTSNN